jgi:hypothetical protein
MPIRNFLYAKMKMKNISPERNKSRRKCDPGRRYSSLERDTGKCLLLSGCYTIKQP